jgi:hypothetical protein
VVFDDTAPQFTVRVAYGTSQKVTSLHSGEFAILRDRNPAAFLAAGLSYDTKFNLGQALDLPFSTDYQNFANSDRVTVTAPITTSRMQFGGFNGDGIRSYGS